jgi:hypothetical protein
MTLLLKFDKSYRWMGMEAEVKDRDCQLGNSPLKEPLG